MNGSQLPLLPDKALDSNTPLESAAPNRERSHPKALAAADPIAHLKVTPGPRHQNVIISENGISRKRRDYLRDNYYRIVAYPVIPGP